MPQPSNQNQGLSSLLREARRRSASDLHLASDDQPWLRCGGEILPLPDWTPFTNQDLQEILRQWMSEADHRRLQQRGSFDGAMTDSEGHRYRFNVYRAGGCLGLALRHLEDQFQDLTDLGLPDSLYRVCDFKDGLVLVAGPTGSGKSTTLASLIHRINQTRRCHIVTIEDPIEYLHGNLKSRISQRQVGSDTDSFAHALVDAVRQDPDVILVGEMRDLDTIRTAVAAAETGHLVFATVHAGDCVSTIERIVSVFPGNEQAVIRNLLSGSLRTIIAQHLLVEEGRPASSQTGRSRSRVLASEILHVNQAVANVIAADNLPQLNSILETHRSDGMHTLDSCLARLWRAGNISERTAQGLARNPGMLRELARTHHSLA